MHQVPRGRAPFRTPRALPSVQSLLLVNLCVVVVVAAVSGGGRVNSFTTAEVSIQLFIRLAGIHTIRG